MIASIHYSDTAASLLRAGQIEVDAFKCPPWPKVIQAAAVLRPVYVHFPLRIGTGNGEATGESGRPPDWKQFEQLLSTTATRYINLHPLIQAADAPTIPVDTNDPHHIEAIAERLIRDVESVVRRFGAERVILENVYDDGGTNLRPLLLPQLLERVIEETGCGLLLDVAHAYLAAHFLDVDWRTYFNALPVRAIREMHLAGIQPLVGQWAELYQAYQPAESLEQKIGTLVDHLPFTEIDFGVATWVLNQVRDGHGWERPWIVALEYGGVGGLWEALAHPQLILNQWPRLYEMITRSEPESRLNLRPHGSL